MLFRSSRGFSGPQEAGESAGATPEGAAEAEVEAGPEKQPSEAVPGIQAIGAGVAEMVDVEAETPILPPPSKAEES